MFSTFYSSAKLYAFALLSFLLLSSGAVTVSFQSVHAQGLEVEPGETLTQPKDRTTKVTAGVHDYEGPSTPILIAPENTSTVVTNTPSFVWKESIDNFSINKYELILDGVTQYAPIPITSTSTADFVLTYSDTTKEYTLVPKIGLSEGLHSWKIVVYDIFDNQTSSVTWTFTIDSRAPVFIVTNIDTKTVAISAQDLNTVPTSPVVITSVQPLIKGSGEALSTVRLTARYQGGIDVVYNFSIGSDGLWEQELDIIPRDIVVYLDFLITDAAGNISALKDIPIIVYTPKVVIAIPTPDAPIEIIVPFISAVEIQEKIVTSIIRQSPATVQEFVASTSKFRILSQDDKSSWGFLAVLSLIVLLLHPIVKTILLAAPYKTNMSFAILKNIWRAIGLVSDRPPQGIVLDAKNQSPLSFCQLYITGTEKNKLPYQVVVVTNKEGVFFRQDLPEGVFNYSVTEKGCLFPSLTQNPGHLDQFTYYQGADIKITSEALEPPIIIPVDVTRETKNAGIRKHILEAPLLNSPVALLTLILVILSPSLINSTSFTCYCLLYLYKRLRKKSYRKALTFLDKNNSPSQFSIVWSVRSDKSHLEDIQQTDAQGAVVLRHPRDAEVQYHDFKQQATDVEAVAKSLESVYIVQSTSHLVNFAE